LAIVSRSCLEPPDTVNGQPVSQFYQTAAGYLTRLIEHSE
jgi:hypothetical protein